MHGIDDPAVVAAVQVYVKLMRASRAVTLRVEARLTGAGLTTTQLGVLEAILHKGRLTPRDLGRKVLTSAGNMTDVLDKLECRGLLRRVPSCTDRRSVEVELTDAGRRQIAGLFPDHARDIARAIGPLTSAELRTLGDLLRRVGLEAEDSSLHLPT